MNLAGCVLVLLMVVAVVVANAFLIQWAWNDVVVYVFGLKAISTLQAFKLALVAGGLVKASQSVNTKQQ